MRVDEPKTIGVFAGLLDRNGKLLLQRRLEKSSLLPGKTFKGDWELPGGKIREKDILKALTMEVFWREMLREAKEELGVEIKTRYLRWPPLYLAVYTDEEKGINDWAFMIPIISSGDWDGWYAPEGLKREVMYVEPQTLKEVANRPKGDQLVSGWGKRMCRMALGALLHSSNRSYSREAEEMLDEIQSDWRETEYTDLSVIGQNYRPTGSPRILKYFGSQ